MAGAPLLTVDGISKSFRGLRAVANVSFVVEEGTIVGLIGPNGAGKTTCFNMIAGVYRPDSGEVRLRDTLLNGLRPDQICRAGVARTFQLVKPFKDMTVEENVVVGALCNMDSVAEARAASGAILDRLGLRSKRYQRAS